MKKSSKTLVFVFCLSLMVVLIPDPVSAHRMIIEQTDSSTLHVRYDDGTNAQLATVTAYNENGMFLFEGKVDHNGYYKFDSEQTPHRFVADDGLGHRVVFIRDNNEQVLQAIPLWIRTFLGVSILLFIAALFKYRTRQKTYKR
ncbi:hypothetical protein N0O92_13460 [Alkalihalobacillus sp. MEB130]|uniref:hypothetical protein n=1 Tax=Alkalihalobacillus sp. MEB130 TaxID=2976704 RepID=UPI0028DE5082|nr:hypothetical protein [Alkalihalobacillus sp. MEB130]MDT8861244.1 hypothetical protein [Alkalihalobacillus sp. MEB130]